MIGFGQRTIAEHLAAAVAGRADEAALRFIRHGQLQWRTWQELWNAATSLAAEIQAAGAAPDDRVAQVSENRYEWVIADLALHLMGAVHVPIHVTLSGQQIAEQIRDSGAKVVFASDEERLATFAEGLPDGITIRLHDGTGKPPAEPGADCLCGLEASFERSAAAPESILAAGSLA